jgi:hypothetical protein
MFAPKTTSFIIAVLPQLEGSPALQSLLMGLLFIASGSAATFLQMMLPTVGRQA